jgi:hypothetical protein
LARHPPILKALKTFKIDQDDLAFYHIPEIPDEPEIILQNCSRHCRPRESRRAVHGLEQEGAE